MPTLAQEHDCLLLDLDGTVFRSTEQAARAARERFRARTTRTAAGLGQGGGRLAAV